MATRLSTHFRFKRIDLGLRPSQVARLLGYKSLVGAANKIVRFEETGDIDQRFFSKLAAVLGVDRTTILQLVEQDRRELVERWSHWASHRIAPHLIARMLPGYFMRHELPNDMTTPDAMELHASNLASDLHQRVWLVLSRKVSVYFDEGGRKRAVQEAAPGQPTEPYRLVRESRRSICTEHGDDIDIRRFRCPQRHGLKVGR